MLFSPKQNKEDWSGILATCRMAGKHNLVLTVENHNLHNYTLSWRTGRGNGTSRNCVTW